MEEVLGRGEGRLRGFPKAAVAADPAKEAFDHPSARMHGEANLILGFSHDIDGYDGCGRGPVARIACIGKGLGDEREGPPRQAQHRSGPIAILHVGGLWVEDESASLRVNQGLTLAALDLLSRVVAARASALGGLHALAVEHCSGRRGASTVPLAVHHD